MFLGQRSTDIPPVGPVPIVGVTVLADASRGGRGKPTAGIAPTGDGHAGLPLFLRHGLWR